MFVYIFTTVVIGFAAAGAVMLLFRLLGRNAPKFVIPFTAAVAMFAYMVWDEYSWFDRYEARLPASVHVTETFKDQTIWSPWSLIKAPINRFTGIDTNKTVQNPAVPSQYRVTTLLIKKGAETLALNHIFDCQNNRRAYVTPQMSLDENGFPEEIREWFPLTSDDPLFLSVCPH